MVFRSLMHRRALLLLAIALPLFAAEEDAPKSSAREALRARIAEDAKKTKPAVKAPAPTRGPLAPAPASTPTSTPPTAATETQAKSETTAAAQAATKGADQTKKSDTTVLPKMEVRKDRITELDRKLAEQEREIAREKRNIKSSEVDSALNDSKIAKPLSIFGGDSSQFRSGVAAERVELMEAEKDIIEAIAQAKTKEEKASLQKQLDELKAMRRQLDKSMR
ncbi:MAG TPA: hypothetical protein VGE76_01305 [Opitutaceae bacterium]